MNDSRPDRDFRSRLAKCVRDGNNVEFCRLLPRATASDLESDYPLTSGATAVQTFHLLGLCCYYGRDKQVEALFQNRVQADLDYKNPVRVQKEALYNSVDPGTPQSVKLLDLIKAEAERRGPPLTRHDYVLSLRTASMVGNISVVQWILEQIQIETPERKFAFRIAATHGQLEVVKFYTEQLTADDLKQMIHHDEDWTFIDTASRGYLQVINFLILKSQEIDNDIDFQHMIHAGRDAAFVHAVHGNHISVVERLLQLTLNHESRHQMLHAGDMFYNKDAAFKYSAQLGYHRILEILVNEIDNVIERGEIARKIFPGAVGSNNLATLQYLIQVIQDEAIQLAVIREAFINQADGDSDDVIQSLELILNIIPAKKEYILESCINQAFVKASQISSTTRSCTVVQEFLLESVKHERRLELVALVEDRQKRRVRRYIQDLQLKEKLFGQTDSESLMIISTIDKFESPNLRMGDSKSLSGMSNLSVMHPVFRVVVVCAKYEEAREFREVLKHRGAIEKEDTVGSLLYHIITDRDENDRPFEIRVYSPRNKAGSVMIGIDAMHILKNISPDWVFMTGVCVRVIQ